MNRNFSYKKKLVLILFFILFIIKPYNNAKASFLLSVKKTDIAINETFDLTLKLKNQSYLFEPKISFLNKDFYILSTQKSSQTTIVNNKFNSEFIWKITLQPKKKGKINIPPISISTKNGEFSTNSVDLNIVNSKKANNKNDVQIFTKISNKNPFQNEAINLLVTIVSQNDLYDLSIEDLKIDNFIIKNDRNISTEIKNINGIEKNIVRINYLITPIKSGVFNIKPIIVKGTILKENNSLRTSFNSFFSNRFNSKRFAIKSKNISLNIKKPLKNFNPWLPAEKISIKEHNINNQELRVGKPISRKFTISTNGISVTQIPQLLSTSEDKYDLKIYSNKPKTTEKIHNNKIKDQRIEEYTIIPQKSGKIEMPEIKIKWWDTKNNVTRFATIDKKNFNVKEAFKKKENHSKDIENIKKIEKTDFNLPLIYLILLATSLILNIALAIKLIKNKQKKVHYSWIKGFIYEIKKIQNIEELEIFISRYVKRKFNKTLLTNQCLELLSKKSTNNQKSDSDYIFKKINKEIEKNKYGKGGERIEILTQMLESEIIKIKNPKKIEEKNNKNSEIKININP
jgi:hypothetical protein